MSRSTILLLFLGILLPSQICSQDSRGHNHHHHNHHSHLDTDPDMELRPVRPPLSPRTTVVREWMHLPTVPNFPDHSDLLMENSDYDDSYDYNTQWPSESSGSAGTESQSAATDEDEYVDPYEGYRDHIKGGSSEVFIARFLIFLSLMISVTALLLSQ